MTGADGQTGAQEQGQGAFDVHLLTLFPEFFSACMKVSVLGRALERELWRLDLVDIRDFTTDKHNSADDTPYGGGAGMVMKPGPVVSSVEAVQARREAAGLDPAPVVALTPGGEVFDQRLARQFSQGPGIILVCGRYEGFDDRALSYVDREVSLGDFVLTGGEPAAAAIVDAVVRLRPGVLGNVDSAAEDSFSTGLLEYPHYTRPSVFRGVPVPDVLKSGDHGRIARWRSALSLLRTLERRPDLLEGVEIDERRQLLEEARAWRDDYDRQCNGGVTAEEGE